jgi:thiol-disulfide isomerase/thioredoxin
MAAFTLEQDNRAQISQALGDDAWAVYCLCAEWCDVCKTYRPAFLQWADEQPKHCFIWVDVEDQADLVGDIDIENFPTLLIQRGDVVAFFGAVLPDVGVAKRLLYSFTEKSVDELRDEASSSAERKAWQTACNLFRRLRTP